MFRGTGVLGQRPVARFADVPKISFDHPGIKPAEATRFDRAVAVLFIVVTTVTPIALEGSVFQDLVWGVASLVSLRQILLDRDNCMRLLRSSLPFLLIIALSLLSFFWSNDPTTTLKRSFALAGSGLISLWIASRFGICCFLEAYSIGTAILAIISAVLIIAAPGIGTGDGAWQGCFGQKNELGRYMVIGIITVTCLLPELHGNKRSLYMGALALFSVLLLGSRSGTSIVTTILVAGVAVFLNYMRKRISNRPMLPVVILGALGAALAWGWAYGKNTLLDALGKDETLTGRTDVWEGALDAVAEQPLLGYGYKVFWLTAGANDPTGRTSTWATQAHNGYIEISLDLGYVGALLAIWLCIAGLIRGFKLFWTEGSFTSAWPIFIMIAFVVSNFTEATMARYYDLSWVVFISAYLFAIRSDFKPVSVPAPSRDA